MTFLDKFTFRAKLESKSIPLAVYFHDLEGEDDSPYALACQAFEQLKKHANSRDEFFSFLLEDCIFTSVYATFYEQLLVAVRENPQYALALIEKFSEEVEERERMIAAIAEDHVQYILNNGLCSGCKNCKHHLDVAELIPYWIERDLNFFEELYIGMQAIQFAMEHLLYDVMPTKPRVGELLTAENILAFRQYIFEYCQSEH